MSTVCVYSLELNATPLISPGCVRDKTDIDIYKAHRDGAGGPRRAQGCSLTLQLQPSWQPAAARNTETQSSHPLLQFSLLYFWPTVISSHYKCIQLPNQQKPNPVTKPKSVSFCWDDPSDELISARARERSRNKTSVFQGTAYLKCKTTSHNLSLQTLLINFTISKDFKDVYMPSKLEDKNQNTHICRKLLFTKLKLASIITFKGRSPCEEKIHLCVNLPHKFLLHSYLWSCLFPRKCVFLN